MHLQAGSVKPDLTIFVNTSDNFEDCWDPFFKLFKHFWNDCPYPIVLNTETKDYHFDGLNISCSKVSVGESRKLSWSECLARGLDSINTPYILYLQEDYFLEAPVRREFIEPLLEEMRDNIADVIRLLELDTAGPWTPSSSQLLWIVDQKAKYRLSLQASLWRKSVLRSQIRFHENPWQLESYGSSRSRRLKEKVCCVNRDEFIGQGKEVFPYKPTGVVAGQWERHIVEPLFELHGIAMDFSKRGFHDKNQRTRKRRSFFLRVIDRIRSIY